MRKPEVQSEIPDKVALLYLMEFTMRFAKAFVAILAIAALPVFAQQPLPYKDKSLAMEDCVADL